MGRVVISVVLPSSSSRKIRSLFDFCKKSHDEKNKEESLPLLFQLELSVANLDRNKQIQLAQLLRESPLLNDDQEMKYLQVMLHATLDLTRERRDYEEMQRLADLLEYGADRAEQYQFRDEELKRLKRERLRRERLKRDFRSLYEKQVESAEDSFCCYCAPPSPASFMEEEPRGYLPPDFEMEERPSRGSRKRKGAGKRSKIDSGDKRSGKKAARDIPDSTLERDPVAQRMTIKLRASGDEPDLTTMLSVCRMRAREIRSMQKTSS